MKKRHSALFYCCVVILVGLMNFSPATVLHAQKRVSDKDVEALMKNLREDSKSFRENFDAALKKSAIRRTSQEKDAKGLVSSFEKQTDSMLSDFKKTKRGDVAVESTITNAQEIERLIHNLQLDAKTLSEWEKIRTELDRVSSAFGINVPYSRM
jgi:predicted ATPase with chaperone activity